MLNRAVAPGRYRGLVRADKTLRWVKDELTQVERMRGRSPDEWPTPTALPERLGRLAELLTELGWDDLAALARREEVTAYRRLGVARPGAFTDETSHALSALRLNLVDLERYEEALAATDAQLRLSGTNRRRAAREARSWRTVILARLGRHEEALESAAVAVEEIRGRLERGGGDQASLELTHALTSYADQLDQVGRVAEAADVTAEVAAYWRTRGDSTPEFARTVDRLSDRLARGGRVAEAHAAITQVIPRLRRRRDHGELAGTWHNFSVRLLALDRPYEALAAGERAVKQYRHRALLAREGHQQVEAEDDWDDDHRYTTAYLLERRQRQLAASQEVVRRAERNLRNALLNLSACLHQLNRVDDAAAASAEAAAIAEAHDTGDPAAAGCDVKPI